MLLGLVDSTDPSPCAWTSKQPPVKLGLHPGDSAGCCTKHSPPSSAVPLAAIHFHIQVHTCTINLKHHFPGVLSIVLFLHFHHTLRQTRLARFFYLDYLVWPDLYRH
ncbi:Uncharacterized protein HZ326_11991 [Fusarium oxysporum f. sp. albedinis]|nr:Uncharacterized protein HZ326_11991 [Fusarium oxysporum f. sp. albedinis]